MGKVVVFKTDGTSLAHGCDYDYLYAFLFEGLPFSNIIGIFDGDYIAAETDYGRSVITVMHIDISDADAQEWVALKQKIVPTIHPDNIKVSNTWTVGETTYLPVLNETDFSEKPAVHPDPDFDY